jgi:ATP-binding protein involved in chromosome partitioning
MAQRVQQAGAVIVSTTQDIALIVAGTALNMVRKVEVPVLGNFEYMSSIRCPSCGRRAVMGSLGGARAPPQQYRVELQAHIPPDLTIRQHTQAGRPPGVTQPDGPQAAADLASAQTVIAKLAGASTVRPFPKIVFEN